MILYAPGHVSGAFYLIQFPSIIFTPLNSQVMSETRFKEPSPLNDVAAFHRTFNMPVLDAPAIPSEERCALRINLLQEELDELKDAIEKKDITSIADALSDIQYVLSGAILEFGLASKFKDLFEEVQRSNMSKACSSEREAMDTVAFYKTNKDTECYYREEAGRWLVYRKSDNKTIKSINYSPANLKMVMDL